MTVARIPIIEKAQYRWEHILKALGLDGSFLTNKHGPCPLCGGEDRFRWDNKNGTGSFFCGGCGAGYGIHLLMKLHNWSFPESARRVEAVLGVDTPQAQRQNVTANNPANTIKKILNECVPVTEGDPVDRYLRGRMIDTSLSDVMTHRGLYESETRKRFPGMVALIRNSEGVVVSVHRTFLQDGRKAQISSPRKVLPPIGTINGAAIRLFEVKQCLGVAEGVESAVAAKQLFGVPCWSVMNANGIKTFQPPDRIRELHIFADNDANFTGQEAAFILARRLVLKKYQVNVHVPEQQGEDFADELAREC